MAISQRVDASAGLWGIGGREMMVYGSKVKEPAKKWKLGNEGRVLSWTGCCLQLSGETPSKEGFHACKN